MKLQVKELSKTFGSKLAVDRISFEMNEPGVFGLIGTNGAGKTTTIRMILGIMRSDSGSAEWDGRSIQRDTLSFGYMPEERGLYMKNKVIDQLIYFGMLRGMSKNDAQKNSQKLMERLGITEYANMNAEKLSKGNQQKVQLAATLVHDPKLIFLDEPFSGLDPVNAEILRGLINSLVADGKYIVLSSHQMTTVEEYCRDILILHNGATALKGNLGEIKHSFGVTKLVIKPRPADIAEYEKIMHNGEHEHVAGADFPNLTDKRAYEYEYSIKGENDAFYALKTLSDNGIYPLKFEIKEPSLQEIFIQSIEKYEKKAAVQDSHINSRTDISSRADTNS